MSVAFIEKPTATRTENRRGVRPPRNEVSPGAAPTDPEWRNPFLDSQSDDHLFKSFENAPIAWWWNALALYWSARYLMKCGQKKGDPVPRVALQPVVNMLAAYAIEALLKLAIVLPNDASSVPKTHNLVELVKTAKIRVNKSDRDVLNHLSKFSQWAGRYPTPLNSAAFDGPEFLTETHLLTEERFSELYGKLRKLAGRSASGPSRKVRR